MKQYTQGMNVRIRNAHKNDLSALLTLYQCLHANDVPEPETAILEQTWKDILSDKKLHCLVADVDGVLAASCVLVIVPNLTRGARSYGLIENVVTAAPYRRKGLATQVLHHALQLAWDQNCYKVMLLTGSKRPEIHDFYEKAGFIKGDKTGFVARPI